LGCEIEEDLQSTANEELTMGVVRVELMAPSHMGKEEIELLLYWTQQLGHVTC
jgi:hypothetical protein